MAASSIQELIKSKIAVNSPDYSAKITISSRSKSLGDSRDNKRDQETQKPSFINQNLRRPTLLKNSDTKVDKAKINVAEAHSTLTRASVHADIEKKAKAHRRVQLGFTRTPRVISKLIT